jgi:hypothetical protein
MSDPGQFGQGSEIGNSIDRQNAEIDGTDFENTPVQPVQSREIYRLDPNTKIPISKFEGPMWKSRRDSAQRAIAEIREGWEEAEFYYNNAQQNHRKASMGNRSGNRSYAKNSRDSYSMTENMVYATVNAIIPSIYAKNPTIEITMTDKAMEDFGGLLKHLANKLASMRASPGVNLKHKVRKSIVRCEITNEAWIMIGWTNRDQSVDQANDDIAALGQELVNAVDRKDIDRIEGELMALEETIDMLDPPGPFVKSFRPEQILIDPTHTEDDYMDATWIMAEVYYRTTYLNAKYRIKNEDGTYASAYRPSHVVDANTATSTEQIQSEVDNFRLFDYNENVPSKYGYSDRDSFERAKLTKCQHVFDKIKRRFMLFADNDWSWPIWVFDDPYHFPDFYPMERLQFHTDPRQTRCRGEVSHYLDQQDEINTIVDEGNRARLTLRENTLFNSNLLTNKDFEDIILNGNKKGKGVKVPDGHKLEDVIFSPPMPALQFQFLWNKDSAIQAINRITGTQDAMRGEQFKTNTTNQAIDQYNSISGVRLDEKRDAIEDFIGAIMYKVLFLCLQFMDQPTVARLIGSQYGPVVQQWRNMTPDEIRTLVVCDVEGGSTQKPTSAAKKAEALQIGQILGQFASNPAVVLVLLKVFEQAFDGIDMTEADWEQLEQLVQSQIQSQQQEAAQGPPQGAQPGPANPQQAQQIVEALVQHGMPRDQAIAAVRQRMQQAGGGQQGAPPPQPPQGQGR